MNSLDKQKLLMTWLEEHTEVEMAILFGSFAKGTENSQSDLDLAVQLASGKTMLAKEKLNYLEQLGMLLETNIDLIDLKKVGQPLLSQIIKYGKLLKGSQTRYVELAIKNINTTQDFMPYIERMLTERRNRWLADG